MKMKIVLICIVLITLAQGKGVQKNARCTGSPSPSPPLTVHTLRPGDINVVAAMGDSITAGTCALDATSTACLGLRTNYRGVSFPIGGDGNYISGDVTIPNILRGYNPTVYGFSLGTGDRNSTGSLFNVASLGDSSMAMTTQANMLISRMQADTNVDFDNDWKLVTIYVGNNDLCQFCGNPGIFTADLFGSRIEMAIQALYDGLPRSFVQLVSVADISKLADEVAPTACGVTPLCPCLRDVTNRSESAILATEIQNKIEEVASMQKFHNKNDFTVVLQPFMTGSTLPMTDGSFDASFFAGDCFHLSKTGHGSAAINLWNSMMEPVGAKPRVWDYHGHINCAAPNDFLATQDNSN